MNPHLADALAYVTELEADPTPPTSAMHVWLMELARERAELLLTLAAEQGKAEGASSEGWVFRDGGWLKRRGMLMLVVEHMNDGWRWEAYDATPSTERFSHGRVSFARAAMQAADRSVP